LRRNALKEGFNVRNGNSRKTFGIRVETGMIPLSAPVALVEEGFVFRSFSLPGKPGVSENE